MASSSFLATHILPLMTYKGSNYTKADKFRDAFLTTHRLFASTTDILKLLLYRFHIANSDQSMRVEERVEVRFMFVFLFLSRDTPIIADAPFVRRVLDILRQWIKGHYSYSLEVYHLEDLRVFLQEITSPPAFASSARGLIDAIDNLV